MNEERYQNIYMGYFDRKEGVEEYMSMLDDHDGREMINRMKEFIPPGSRILELGMGPGKDLEILSETFSAVGSDRSEIFLDLYRKKNPSAEIIRLDAVIMDTSQKFDGIYSNKVLHHLSREELSESLVNQARVLNKGGIILHSFWYGEGEEFFDGLRFTYYHENEPPALCSDEFEILDSVRYGEFEEGDSFYLIMKKI